MGNDVQQSQPMNGYTQQSYEQSYSDPQQQQKLPQSNPGPQTLHVYSEGAFSRGYRITDTDKTTPLYNVVIHSWSKPNIQIFSVLPQKGFSNEVGSGTFRSFSSSIEMVVHGQSIHLTRNGTFSSGHQWRSPSLGGRLLKWKNEGSFTSGKYCYVDDNKQHVVARWEHSSMSISKAGKIHILDPSMSVPGSSGFDELVVSAVIQMEVTRRRSNNSAAAGGGAAGGGAC